MIKITSPYNDMVTYVTSRNTMRGDTKCSLKGWVDAEVQKGWAVLNIFHCSCSSTLHPSSACSVPQEIDLNVLYWWNSMISDFQVGSTNGEPEQDIKQKIRVFVLCVTVLVSAWNVNSGLLWLRLAQGGLPHTTLTFLVLVPSGLEVVRDYCY